MFRKILAGLLTAPLLAPMGYGIAEEIPPELETGSTTITIRHGSDIIWSGETSFPLGDATTTVSSTSGDLVSVPARSVLAALIALDATEDEFAITDLSYFSSFDSFLINCISAPVISAEPQCDNWQYVVNGIYAQVGTDDYLLNDGDVVFVYFGSPRRVSLSDASVSVGEPFTATAERYVPENDTYEPATEFTIGVTQTNPDDPFTPLEIATSTVDESGQATFSLDSAGSYAVGLKEDFYFPTTALTVSEVPTPSSPPAQGGGSTDPSQGAGPENTPTSTEVDISSAMAFLVAAQNANGSFATPILTDWAAIAFAAGDASEAAKNKLRDYLVSTSAGLSNATDYERRAMALMALGINPFTGTSLDYIAKILSYFDGTQFGDNSLVNDDIFAIYPLVDAGYTSSDDVILKTVAFIVTKQKSDGSWENSVDLTAAAVQALVQTSSLANVTEALEKAKTYLHSKQQTNGGFENGQSTSWALQAIAAFGDPISSWTVDGKTPEEYLALLQQIDGGLEAISTESHTRLWSTEYAIPASLGRTWNSILQNFSKPTISQTSNSGGGSASNSPEVTTIASTTPEVASTTPLVLGISTSTVSATSSIRGHALPETVIATPVQEKKIIVEKAPVKKNTQKQQTATSTLLTPPSVSVIVPPPSNTTQVAAAATVETHGFSSKLFGFLKKIGSFIYNILF